MFERYFEVCFACVCLAQSVSRDIEKNHIDEFIMNKC